MPSWAKALLYVTPYEAQLTLNAVEYVAPFNTPEALEWRRLMLRFEDTVSIDTADDAWITMDIVNVSAGTVDVTWDEGDYGSVETQLSTAFTAWSSHMSNNMKLSEVRWYRRMFAPYGELDDQGNPVHFLDSGPPVRITTLNIPGLVTVYGTPQVAWSITETTSRRANWGRFYLPRPEPTAYQSNGQLSSTMLTTVATIFFTMYDNLMAAQLFPCVPTTTVDKVISHGLLTVDGIQMDSVADIIRRRRPQHAGLRVRYPA